MAALQLAKPPSESRRPSHSGPPHVQQIAATIRVTPPEPRPLLRSLLVFSYVAANAWSSASLQHRFTIAQGVHEARCVNPVRREERIRNGKTHKNGRDVQLLPSRGCRARLEAREIETRETAGLRRVDPRPARSWAACSARP